MDNIDKISGKLVTPFTKITDALITIGLKSAGKLSPEEVAALNLPEVVMRDLGGAELVSAISAASGAVAVATNPNLTAAIGTLNDQYFIAQLGNAGANVQKVIADAFVSNVPENVLKLQLQDALKNLSEEKIGSLLNTAIRTTERMAYAELVSDVPEDTVFEYVGPSDDKNRPFCARWVGQTITYKDLQSLMNDEGEPAITDCGGYNCRHNWEIV